MTAAAFTAVPLQQKDAEGQRLAAVARYLTALLDVAAGPGPSPTVDNWHFPASFSPPYDAQPAF